VSRRGARLLFEGEDIGRSDIAPARPGAGAQRPPLALNRRSSRLNHRFIAFTRAAMNRNRSLSRCRQAAEPIQLSLTMAPSRPSPPASLAMVAFAAPWVYRRAFALTNELTGAE